MIFSSAQITLQLAIVLPLVATLAIAVAKERPNIRETISLSVSAFLLVMIYTLYQDSAAGNTSQVIWLDMLPGLSISFATEPLGLLFALMASFLWLVTNVYSIGYMRRNQEKHQTRFYQFFSISIAAVMGISFADNLFTLYIFYELLTLSTYPLVTHKGNSKAKQGGRVYLAILLSTSIVFFLLAIVGTWLVGGTLDFTSGGIFTSPSSPPWATAAIAFLLPLFIFGIGKAAIFPFHRWLPAAMVAPTPVSALLHAVAVVKGGVFTILKVCIYIFGLESLQALATTQALLYLAGFSVFVAALVAMRQDNLKKRLAYSTVSQLGYITIGALLANSAGVIGATMQMVIHAFGKITLFFCAGAILIMTKKTNISDMRGIGHQMPITMGAFFIASLSIIGLPPTAGMWSKWFLLQGTIAAEQWLLMVTLGLSSLLSILYLLPISLRAFFAKPIHQQHSSATLEAPLPVLIAICICAAGCLILFLFPQPLYQLSLSILPAAD